MVEVINLCKSFKDKIIFKDFNLGVEDGEFIGIVGKSGQGKTTLLNIIGTLEKADSGIVKIMGKEIATRKEKRILLRDRLGFVFQNYALVDNASVNENLEIALKHKKMNRKQKYYAIALALKDVGLDNYGDKIVHTLSGGEQQRIAIARLLLKDPALILADEPTGSLDIENRDVVVALFEKLHKQGKTIIMVTHDKNLAKFFSRTIEL
ncbi:ATP-binding cassette domain-containing protein [Inconstantimicrobium mannanitabidum]|uniref:ABC transporter ATP-binding protein n=1 Tax=Inconstantimicrobium mannanitabidum TaxID=1604901 RepID=A0ACB5RBL4_9CLOT|nr:ATP-binding cassette domain-containing protein [Clostridium sp. TW13]GKX66633.1 ABC transporter ATP-binding protein [Clostridium sp. TW13]